MYDDIAYAVDPQHVEGEMTVGTKQRSTLGEPEFNTLDEPIKDTIVRVRYLFYYFCAPRFTSNDDIRSPTNLQTSL